jgi:hypothetical protein
MTARWSRAGANVAVPNDTGVELSNGTKLFTKAESSLKYRQLGGLVFATVQYSWNNRNSASGEGFMKLVITDPGLTSIINSESVGIASIVDCGEISCSTNYRWMSCYVEGNEIFILQGGTDNGNPQPLLPMTEGNFADTGGNIGFDILFMI